MAAFFLPPTSWHASSEVRPMVAAGTLRTADAETRHIHGPAVDVVLLGGGSLLLLVAVRFGLGLDEAESFAASMVLANLINHPHFAHSYQIFYRAFHQNIASHQPGVRIRYILAGIVVPILLISLLGITIALQSAIGLSLAVNLMIFMVGWHYAKQGYGIAMVDSVFKKLFFTPSEKVKLLRNAYATWLFSWALVSNALAGRQNDYWGISYDTLQIPRQVIVFLGMAALATAIDLVICLWRRARQGADIPWNGVVAYGVSIYPWLLWRDPVMLLWYPMLHSLQYLAVVWRFEINRTCSIQSPVRPVLRLILFLSLGLFLGHIGFWTLPEMLNTHLDFPPEIFGHSLFLFTFWIFINIHHYFIDAVMWRRGNHEVGQYLFNPPPRNHPVNALSRPAPEA